LGSTVLLAVGLNTFRLDWQLDQLQAECQEEAARERKKEPDFDFEMICDPSELESSIMGVQGALATAWHRQNRWNTSAQELWLQAGVLIIVLGSLPAVWYFLLRRIRELSAAITGK
jgi:hypothetical protein